MTGPAAEQRPHLELVRESRAGRAGEPTSPAVRLGDIYLRNRLVTSSSLLAYGVPNSHTGQSVPSRLLGKVINGMSPIAAFVPLERFGAVTTRTLTLKPREGHFTTQDVWNPREIPGLLKRYNEVLRKVDGGWLNAFGWANVGIDKYLQNYFPRTREQNTILSVGGFSAEEFSQLVSKINERIPAGDIAAVEFNVSCHNVNFDFNRIIESVLAEAVPASNHPVILKLSPDYDYLAHARMAAEYGVSALTAINTVKGLRLDPKTGTPLLKNGFGGISGRAIKPIGLRVVKELRDAGVTLPIIATGGIRSFDDCREYFWAGADAVSLGSASWFASYPGYALAPLHAARIRRLLAQVERYEPKRDT